METFSALLAICAGNSLVPGEFPLQRPVMRSFDVFFYLHPNRQLSEQSGDLRRYRAHYALTVMSHLKIDYISIISQTIFHWRQAIDTNVGDEMWKCISLSDTCMYTSLYVHTSTDKATLVVVKHDLLSQKLFTPLCIFLQ